MDLIEQDGKCNRRYEGQHQIDDTHRQCVADYLEKCRIREQPGKLIQTDKFRAEDSILRFVILEGHQPAKQRDVTEYNPISNENACPDHQNLLLFKLLPVKFCFCFFRFRSYQSHSTLSFSVPFTETAIAVDTATAVFIIVWSFPVNIELFSDYFSNCFGLLLIFLCIFDSPVQFLLHLF